MVRWPFLLYLCNMKIVITEHTHQLLQESIVFKELNPNIKVIKANYGEIYYNYITEDGVEVTLTRQGEPGYLNGEQVDGDFTLDAIGSKNRGFGFASKELKRIVDFADKYNYSIALKVDSESATTSPQGIKHSEIGLSDEQLKSWYSRYGFIFDKKSSFGYRPKKTEKQFFANKNKKTQIPIHKIDVSKIEGVSDPDTLQNLLSMGELKEGVIYEDGDDTLYLFQNGSLLEIDNIVVSWSWEKQGYELKEK